MFGKTPSSAIFVAAIALLGGCADSQNIPPLAATRDADAPPLLDAQGSALRMARATRSAGVAASAIQIYRNLIASGTAPEEAKLEFGDVLLEAGEADDAIDAYSQVGAKSPARLASLLGMTRAYIGLGDPAKALDCADQALLLGPRDAKVLVDRGVALDSLDRHTEAQHSYRAVLSVAPHHVSARNNLALSLALVGQYDEAVALITPLVRSSSATSRVRENMAVIYGLMGDADHAAVMSRMDLDEGTTKDNLAFLAAVRGAKP